MSPWAAVADLAGWRGGGEAAGREAERQGGERRVARVNVLSLEDCHVAANFVFVVGVRGSGVKEAVQCVRGGLDGPIVLRMGELLRGQGVRPGLSVMGGRLPLDVPEALIADAMVEDEVVVDVLQAAVEHHCMQALMSSVIRSKQDHGRLVALCVCVCVCVWVGGGCTRVHVSLSFSHVHACVHPGTRRCRCGDEGVGQCHYLFGTDARGDNGALVPCVERRACMCPEPDQDVWLKTLAHLVVSLISPGMALLRQTMRHLRYVL